MFGNAATRFGIREMGRFLVPLESPAGCFREGLCRVDVFMPSSWLFGGVEISTLVCDCFRTESDGERGGLLGVVEMGRRGDGVLIVDGDGPGGPSHVFDPAECWCAIVFARSQTGREVACWALRRGRVVERGR